MYGRVRGSDLILLAVANDTDDDKCCCVLPEAAKQRCVTQSSVIGEGEGEKGEVNSEHNSRAARHPGDGGGGGGGLPRHPCFRTAARRPRLTSAEEAAAAEGAAAAVAGTTPGTNSRSRRNLGHSRLH